MGSDTTDCQVGGCIIVHAFDDPDVIAGQGTIGLELLEDLPDVDRIYVPIGGGGLAAAWQLQSSLENQMSR